MVVHEAFLLALAKKLCRSQIDPHDLVQDTFEKVLRAGIPECVNECAWLARILHNTFVDAVRRQTARREELGDVADATSGRSDDGAWWEVLTADEVRAQRLPEEQRITFELFAFEGESYDAIAARLRIAKATVGTRILRARQRLRVLLVEHHTEAAETPGRGAAFARLAFQ